MGFGIRLERPLGLLSASLLFVPGVGSGAQGGPCPCHVRVTLGHPGKAPGAALPGLVSPSPPRPAMAIRTVSPPALGLLPTPLSGPGRPDRIPSEAHPPCLPPPHVPFPRPCGLWVNGHRRWQHAAGLLALWFDSALPRVPVRGMGPRGAAEPLLRTPPFREPERAAPVWVIWICADRTGLG